MYFNDCHTPDELKIQYRYWSKKLHPDMGGNKADFQAMQAEYKSWQPSKSKLPNIFRKDGNYEWMRKPVKYAGTEYNYYYHFEQSYGAKILIDLDHIHLIFTKRLTVK